MSLFILLHGAFHGGWCWSKVSALLNAAGQKVMAPDLAGQGFDPTPVTEMSLDIWRDSVCALVDQAQAPVILVGHSLGGLTTQLVSEARPDKIALAVYLAAFLLPNGFSPQRFYQSQKTASVVMAHATVDEESGIVTFDPGAAKRIFYNTTPASEASIAASHLRPLHRSVLGTPLRLSEDRFGRVPRAYIETTDDQALPPALQEAMIAYMPCDTVIRMAGDHSPFLSAPEILTEHLLALARRQPRQ